MSSLRRIVRHPTRVLTFALIGSTSLFCATPRHPPPGLQITFGPKGLETLTYAGVVFENTTAVPADAFHIWHMKATDLHGKPLKGGQFDWGENTQARAWDPHTLTWTYQYHWGSISTRYLQVHNALDIIVTVANAPNSGIIFDGASIYPLALHLPALPAGFGNSTYAQLAFNTTGPGVTVADYGRGEVAAVSLDAGKPLYTGFAPTDNGTAYTTLLSGTSPDDLPAFQPHNDRPLRPGETDTFRLSLRFAPPKTPLAKLAADAYSNWARAFPPTLHWTDRRPIGTVFLASSPSGDPHYPGGFPNNPRRYFNDSSADDFDVKTPAGLGAFQQRILAQARTNVTNLTALGAQGAITWDIEGEQFPQDTSYVCAPDQIAKLAPEMESTISDPTSPYIGMKLDDAYFKIIRSAGFRVGVCVRPQHLSVNHDGTAQQNSLPLANVAQELARKIRYAHDRWGATLFYIDSTVDADHGTLPAAIFKQVASAFPDSLLIPEESTPLYYAYTAPFQSFIYRDATGTPSDVYDIYPQAFSAVLINNVAPAKLAASLSKLAEHVQRGDVLMGQVNYRETNNATITSLYQRASRKRPGNAKSPAASRVVPGKGSSS